jgi:hypothetical protein
VIEVHYERVTLGQIEVGDVIVNPHHRWEVTALSKERILHADGTIVSTTRVWGTAKLLGDFPKMGQLVTIEDMAHRIVSRQCPAIFSEDSYTQYTRDEDLPYWVGDVP